MGNRVQWCHKTKYICDVELRIRKIEFGVKQEMIKNARRPKEAHIVQGVQKKMRRSSCLISLATDMLESWDIIHWKGGIHSFVRYGSRDISK